MVFSSRAVGSAVHSALVDHGSSDVNSTRIKRTKVMDCILQCEGALDYADSARKWCEGGTTTIAFSRLLLVSRGGLPTPDPNPISARAVRTQAMMVRSAARSCSLASSVATTQVRCRKQRAQSQDTNARRVARQAAHSARGANGYARCASGEVVFASDMRVGRGGCRSMPLAATVRHDNRRCGCSRATHGGAAQTSVNPLASWNDGSAKKRVLDSITPPPTMSVRISCHRKTASRNLTKMERDGSSTGFQAQASLPRQ